MICPRCAHDISENETRCPFCHTEIDTNLEFNDYKKDGFVRLKLKEGTNPKINSKKNKKNKYLKYSELRLVVISVIFLLVVSVVTIFGFKILQYLTNDTPADYKVPVYTPAYEQDSNENKIQNTIKEVTISNIYGSWKSKDATENKNYAIPYFSFAKDGAAQYDYGSFSVFGYYIDYSSEKHNRIYIEIENKISGIFDFNVTGNENDGYQMTLKNIHSGFTYILVSAEAKTYTLNTIENFSVEEKVIGKWENKDGIKGYEFTKDGRFTRWVDDQVMRGVWTKSNTQENVLVLKYMENTISTTYVTYASFEEALVINDVIYYKKQQDK